MYDVIVIGSGIGGLSAAGLLAKVAGKKVLVLEKHSEPGGQTHTFRRDGAHWNVGVHYVGDMEQGSTARRYFDYLSDGHLRWNNLSNVSDRLVFPGIDVEVGSNQQEYRDRLVRLFPEETRAIDRYFRDAHRMQSWLSLYVAQGMVPKVMAPVLRLLGKATGSTALSTTKEYLDRNVRSPQLKAILAAAWGDYGVVPSKSAFAVHGMIVAHSARGTWFPDGGSAMIARTLEQGIEAAGGAVQVCQEVTEILIDDGRAVGVSVLDNRGPVPVTREYRAETVISNIGVEPTFGQLLAHQPQSVKVMEQLQRIGTGISGVMVYIKLKDDPTVLGIDGGNILINTGFDHDDQARARAGLLSGQPTSAMVCFPSAKLRETTHHTAEILVFTDAVFHRNDDYPALKERMARGLIDLADSVVPGFADLVDYYEVGTPLTVEKYTSHPHGAFYGVPVTPQRFKEKPFGPRTEIPGLYLSGQDVSSLGVVGALMGGVAAASQVLGARGVSMINHALNKPPKHPQQQRLPEHKYHATLTAKKQLMDSVWQLDFELDRDAGDWTAGQYARLCVGGFYWRDYSIAGISGRVVRLLVSTRTGGHGSRFASTSTVGTSTQIELPLGSFCLTESSRKQVFIATGTGIAPMLPMFHQVTDAVLLFGARSAATDLTVRLADNLPENTMRCYSREGEKQRVTDLLPTLELDWENTDFYLCGSAAMVADCQKILTDRGARHVFTEKY